MSSATETKLLTPPWARGEKPKCKEKEKLRRHLSEGYAPEDPKFDLIVKSAFPGAISNKELETKMVDVLAEKGFHDNNTLLATSLCCDELARRLEDDLGRVYGNNFTLGGLAGFPFALLFHLLFRDARWCIFTATCMHLGSKFKSRIRPKL